MNYGTKKLHTKISCVNKIIFLISRLIGWSFNGFGLSICVCRSYDFAQLDIGSRIPFSSVGNRAYDFVQNYFLFAWFFCGGKLYLHNKSACQQPVRCELVKEFNYANWAAELIIEWNMNFQPLSKHCWFVSAFVSSVPFLVAAAVAVASLLRSEEYPFVRFFSFVRIDKHENSLIRQVWKQLLLSSLSQYKYERRG